MHPVPISTTYAQSQYQSVRYYEIESTTAPRVADLIWKLEAVGLWLADNHLRLL